jgi:UDP-galactopyranose mutase
MLVAFSHLRWNFVWQRPQHLLSRLARDTPVLFVEEPIAGCATSDVDVRRSGAVIVVTPRLSAAHGFGPAVNGQISRLLESFVPPGSEPIFWYYTPMALGAEPANCRPCLRVYDAMDDLASFAAAPPELRVQEERLLSRVDLVYAGGPTLFRQRRDKHPAVHCFPSGVEPEHFGRSTPRSTLPAELAARRAPILGYYGVIDERLDLDLLAQIAEMRPAWTIALVGPTAKIDEADIPVRPNILRFGQQAYEDLPAYLACFDVALMPFARRAHHHHRHMPELGQQPELPVRLSPIPAWHHHVHQHLIS